MKREQKKNIENIEKLIQEKKKIPKNVKDKINAKVFENMVLAAIILVYLAALNIGMGNIPTDTYIIDLKVFSMLLLAVTIIIFEIGYKKDDAGLWLHGVEVMVVAIFTLYLIYFYSMYYATYGTLLISTAIVFLIYFAIKMIITRKRLKRQYQKSLTDIGEIVKK